MFAQLAQALKRSSVPRRSLWLPLAFVLLTGGLLVLLTFTLLAYQLLYLHRAYPGVTVADEPAGGLSRTEIASQVEQLSQGLLSRPVTIRAADQSWTFTGRELGLRVDTAATADRAFAIGRAGNLLADIPVQLSLLSQPRNVEPVIRYDTGPTNQVLQQLSDAVNYPPQNAELMISPEGVVEIKPSQDGRRFHIEGTRPYIEAAVLGHGPTEIQAITQQVLPPIATEDLAPLQTQARQLLSQPFVFSAKTGAEERRAWQISPDQMATLLTVTENIAENGHPRLSLELSPTQLQPYLEKIAEAIERDAVDARLYFNDDRGQLEVIQASQDGRSLDVAAAQTQTKAAIDDAANQVELPVIITTPTIASSNLEELGIVELVSESTSYYKGSSGGRMRNIALAASKFDGVIVPPGEVFSFNETLGPITKEEGYDESLIIYGNRTTVGIGGGVCQVSTTAFRAALFGGYELVERWAHGYRVGWYETNSQPGLDATIYTPDIDLRFRNDSGHHLLIQTETNLDAGTLTFKFYGTPTNREVIISEPVVENVSKPPPPLYEEVTSMPVGAVKQIDWAKDGMDVTVTRVVKDGDDVLYEDEIVSRYRPWQAVYQVGIDPARLNRSDGLLPAGAPLPPQQPQPR